MIFILGFTAFFEPIINEFGWSYTQVSLAASLLFVGLVFIAAIIMITTPRIVSDKSQGAN